MARKLKIDIVSDVVCPWCAIGVARLDMALGVLGGEIDVDLAFHPSELNPDLPAGGENGLEHLARKYGISPAQVRANRAMIGERAAAVGFTMNVSDASRIASTFAAHRLIARARDRGRQPEMERRLLALYVTDQRDVSVPETLAAAAATIGLDEREAGRCWRQKPMASRCADRGTAGVDEGWLHDRHHRVYLDGFVAVDGEKLGIDARPPRHAINGQRLDLPLPLSR